MAPSRKSRSVNKRFSSVRETASSKDKITDNASKNRLKASPGIQKVNLFLYFFEKKFFLNINTFTELKQRKKFPLCSLTFCLSVLLSRSHYDIFMTFLHFINVKLGSKFF